MPEPGLAFWALQGPGWLLFLYLVAAQCLPAFDCQLGVRMGTQEPAERITAVGVALFRGLAVGDLLFYTPLLGAGLAGHLFGWSWGGPLLAAALGITVYRPIACLATVRNARGTPGWTLPKEASHRAVLPAVARWGARGHWHLAATA